MPNAAAVAPGFERPSFQTIQVALVCGGRLTCRCAATLLDVPGHALAREHWAAGHFDRRPLDTSTLPPARRIVGRGAPTA